MFDSAFEAILREQHLSSHSSTESLSDTFLEDLVAEVDNEHIRGIVLGGSQARGDATPYSDVDLACFVTDTFRPLRKRFMYRDGHLISISLKTLEGVKQQLTDPYQALWIVPSFRETRMLLVRQDWIKTGQLSIVPDMSSNETKALRLQRYSELR